MAKLKILLAAASLVLNLLLTFYFYNEEKRTELVVLFGMFAMSSVTQLVVAIRARKQKMNWYDHTSRPVPKNRIFF